MVNNQEWFNKEYPKEETEIELKYEDYEEEQGKLIIEDYPKLEKLCLMDNKGINKIILRNLPLLQECEIWSCGMQDLVIENCPQVKELNIENNSLTNLGFLVNLGNLEELKINGNVELIEILNPYQGDWKAYQKDIREIFELTKQKNFQGLAKKFWDLKKSREDLKKDVLFLQEKFGYGVTSKAINTKEIFLNLEEQFKDKEEKINSLESRVQALIDLSEQQRKKIIDAYLVHFSSEKELLQELIKVQLKLKKTQKQKLRGGIIKGYREQFNYLYEKLAEKLNEESMEELELILANCEDLVAWELELEDDLRNKALLIEEQEKVSQEIGSDEKKEKVKQYQKTHRIQLTRRNTWDEVQELKLGMAEMKGTITALNRPTFIFSGNQSGISIATGDNANQSNQITTTYQTQYNIQYQQLMKEIKQEVNDSLIDIKEITPQEQQVINQTVFFLGAKELFINYRQAIISKLINCYCKLAGKNKSTKFATFSSVMGITGKIAKIIPGGGVAEEPLGIVGDVVSLTGTIIQEKNLDKCIKEFQRILAEDEKSLPLFDENYRSLTQAIWPDNDQREVSKTVIDKLQLDRTKLRPFNDDFNAFKIGDVWKQNFSNLSSDELRSFVESLDKGLESFRQEFQQQRSQLAEQSWFKAIEKQTDLLQEQPQAQILQPTNLPQNNK